MEITHQQKVFLFLLDTFYGGHKIVSRSGSRLYF